MSDSERGGDYVQSWISPEDAIRSGARAAGHPYASRDQMETMVSRLEELEGRIAELELRARTQDNNAAETRDRG